MAITAPMIGSAITRPRTGNLVKTVSTEANRVVRSVGITVNSSNGKIYGGGGPQVAGSGVEPDLSDYEPNVRPLHYPASKQLNC